MSKYIGYFNEYDGDEIVDDFKEWCEANSVKEATEIFKNRYRKSSRIKLDFVRNDK